MDLFRNLAATLRAQIRYGTAVSLGYQCAFLHYVMGGKLLLKRIRNVLFVKKKVIDKPIFKISSELK